MRLRRSGRVLAVAAAASLIVVACGGDDDSADDTTEEDADDQSGDDATDDATDGADDESDGESDGAESTEPSGDGDADGEVQRGGSLVIASTQVPRTLNGLIQSGYATALPGTQLNAGLVLYGDDYEPQPYLAESWEVSDDGLQVTINLVDGAVFHDGEPITSEDVAFSVITARDHHPFATMFGPVTSVDTPDPLTAVINLSQPHPAILLAMSPALLPIMPAHIYDDGQDITTHPRNTEDFVGSGPFRLVEYNPESLIRLERFEDFFLEDLPYLDEIVIQITPDQNTIALGLENGSIHLSLGQGAANTIRWQGGDNPVVSNEGSEAFGQLNWLEFNLSDPVLSIPEVRQAIAHALDRTLFVENVEFNLSIPATTAIAPDSPFHNPDATTYDYDVEQARQLLADAGFGEGDIELAIDTIPGAFEPQAEFVVQALEEIGIDATLSVSPDFPTWAERIASGNFQATINNVWNWGDPVIGVDRTYLTSNQVGVIWTNNTGYSNTEVDRLLTEAGQELDPDRRTDLYAEFQEQVNLDVPIVYLSSPRFWQAMTPALRNPPQGIWGQMSPMLDVWLED